MPKTEENSSFDRGVRPIARSQEEVDLCGVQLIVSHLKNHKMNGIRKKKLLAMSVCLTASLIAQMHGNAYADYPVWNSDSGTNGGGKACWSYASWNCGGGSTTGPSGSLSLTPNGGGVSYSSGSTTQPKMVRVCQSGTSQSVCIHESCSGLQQTYTCK